MLVMNKEGDMFDERRKDERRVCKRRDSDLTNKNSKELKYERRKNDRRVENINKKKI